MDRCRVVCATCGGHYLFGESHGCTGVAKAMEPRTRLSNPSDQGLGRKQVERTALNSSVRTGWANIETKQPKCACGPPTLYVPIWFYDQVKALLERKR